MHDGERVLYRDVSELERIELTSSNFNMLKSELRRSSCSTDSYLNCPAYYLLTARKGGYMLKSSSHRVVVCQHPHEPFCQIIMPEFSTSKSYELTCELLKQRFAMSDRFVLGKYSEEASADFIAQSGIRTQSVVDTTMDWAFPIRIHSCRMISEVRGSEFAKIRGKVRSALKAGVFVGPSGNKNLSGISAITQEWLVGHEVRAEVPSGYYSALAKLVGLHQSEFSELIALDKHGKLVGLMIWRVATEKHANVYAHLASREINGLSDLLMWTAASCLHKQGIEYMNVGGSETKRLDDYKKKYNPVISLYQSSYEIL